MRNNFFLLLTLEGWAKVCIEISNQNVKINIEIIIYWAFRWSWMLLQQWHGRKQIPKYYFA